MIYRRSVVVRQGTSFASQGSDSSVSTIQFRSPVNKTALLRVVAQLAVVIGLVVLAALNISLKGWTEMEDGVLWVSNGSDVVASVVAEDSPASRAGIKPGDVLLRIDTKLVQRPEDVVESLHASTSGSRLEYVVARQGDSDLFAVQVARIPSGTHWLYLALASVGMFTLLVGAGVRLRRPENQATLHFFWLTRRVLRRAGVLVQRPARSRSTGSSTGATWWRCCCCRRSSSTSRSCFPSVPTAGRAATRGRSAAAAAVPAGAAARRRQGRDDRPRRRGTATCSRASSTLVERAELLYLALCLVGGLVIMIARALPRAVGDGAPAAAMDRRGERRSARCRSCSGTRCRLRSGSRRARGFELTARAPRRSCRSRSRRRSSATG